ncbi:CRAL-TRIO domain-containing protein [Ilyonectria sp. MPI-CAGE-AT-0026]|nr:CRAL-TRIO domain-containing protein [Ilyonectria sp. MPI-CAGE-AT-0026]
MPHSTQPGTVGNLTVDEQQKLQQAWVHLLRLCEADGFSHEAPDKSQQFLKNLKDKSPETFRQGLWNSILADHPDATVLRFLRARNWDVTEAMDMLASAINWRNERQVDEEIVGKGETVGMKLSPTVDEEAFVTQYRSGKSYVRGSDKDGHPIYIIKVRLHDPHLQSATAMETYVLHNIETIRVLARGSCDKACLVFDLTGFGLRNMDFHVVKFLVEVLEARYPETLGVVLVHNAPFVFWGLWNVIKRWLDPVISSKIHFTSNNKGLTPFISKDNLQTCYGGHDNWEYKYVDPTPSEVLQSEEKKASIQAERNDLIQEFNRLTAEWASLEPGCVGAEVKAGERSELAKQLQQHYWKLDPYVRARTYYHRVGVIDSTGEVDFKAAN